MDVNTLAMSKAFYDAQATASHEHRWCDCCNSLCYPMQDFPLTFKCIRCGSEYDSDEV